MRTFEDKPAVREMTPLLIALTSPSGCGKTKSALRLASGMQRVLGGEIFHIDTEAGRALHYADEFKFRHVPFGPPYGSLDYLAAIRHCASRGASVTIIDSTSHEHEGEGGHLDEHAEQERKLRGASEAAKWSAWNIPKEHRKKLMQGILQLQSAFIFCFRAKQKRKPARKRAGEKLAEGQDAMIELGWMPIGGDEFIYEMTLSLLFQHGSNGVPVTDIASLTDSQKLMFKIPGQFEKLFKQPRQLDESIGEALAKWATGGKALPQGWHAEQAKAASAATVSSKPEVPLNQCVRCGQDFAKDNPAPACSTCGGTLRFKASGISQRTSEPYHAFWGCPEKCVRKDDRRKNTSKDAEKWHDENCCPIRGNDDAEAERAAIAEAS